MQYVTKTRQDTNVVDSASAVYIKNEIELSRPIWSGVVYDKN